MTDSKKRSFNCVKIDACAWLTEDGVESTVYIGNDDDPAAINVEPFDELIHQALSSYCSYGKISNKSGNDNIGEAEKVVIALEDAAVLAREVFEGLKEQ
jgi:hypothetical protein